MHKSSLHVNKFHAARFKVFMTGNNKECIIFKIFLTNYDHSILAPSDANIDLMWVCDEAQVLALPSQISGESLSIFSQNLIEWK